MVTRRYFGYLLRDALKEVDSQIAVDLGFSESLLDSWPMREAFIFFSLIADPDAPTWRAWLGYKNPGIDGEYKPPKRNADAYLRFLTSTGDSISSPAVERLASEPRNKARGLGGANLWDRAVRFLELRDTLGIDERDDAITFLLRIFDPKQWTDGTDRTALADFGTIRPRCVLLAREAQEARPDAPLTEQLRTIARRLRHMIATREPFEPLGTTGLKVATLWGAKGMTAEHVYVIGLCNEALPGVRRDEYPGSDLDYLEEQRRLFYVSLTRSKRTLVLSRATRIHASTAKKVGLPVKRVKGHYADLQMSDFLHDIISLLPGSQPGPNWAGCGA